MTPEEEPSAREELWDFEPFFSSTKKVQKKVTALHPDYVEYDENGERKE